MSISVIIITRNSGRSLGKVLESVKGFDEVIVCDMESEDNTLEIARANGARVESIPVSHDGSIEEARNNAIKLSSNDWIFAVEDDEIVPPALAKALYRHIRSDSPSDALYIPRRNIVMDRFNPASYPDYRLRFFRRGTAYWPDVRHSQAVVEGSIDKLPSNHREYALVHVTPSVLQMTERISHDSKLGLSAHKNKITLYDMIMIPMKKFFRSYILRGNITLGVPGLLISYDSAVREIYKLGRRYEDLLPKDLIEKNIIADPNGESLEEVKKKKGK